MSNIELAKKILQITRHGYYEDQISKIAALLDSCSTAKPNVSGWVSVHDALPEILETVWISNGKGWTTLGCRSDYYEGDNGELVWCWAASKGIIYEEEGKIVAECEEDDLDVCFWHRLPVPPCR